MEEKARMEFTKDDYGQILFQGTQAFESGQERAKHASVGNVIKLSEFVGHIAALENFLTAKIHRGPFGSDEQRLEMAEVRNRLTKMGKDLEFKLERMKERL